MDKVIDLIEKSFQVSEKTAILLLITAVVLILSIVALLIAYICHKNTPKKVNSEKSDLNINETETTLEDVNVNENESMENEIDIPKAPILEAKEDKVEVKEDEIEKEEIKEEKEEVEVEKQEETLKVETEEVKTSKGKYEIFNVGDFYLYRLKASNGEILVLSEIYTSLKGAMNAVATVKRNLETGFIQIYKDKHNLWQFKLFAANKRLLAVSANYTTQQGCESAANSFKRFAAISPIIELEEDKDHLLEEIFLEAMQDKKGGKLIIEQENGIYEFKLCASNGAILCSSSEYTSKNVLLQNITIFKEAVRRGRFLVVKDKNKMFQFKLYTTSGRCIVIGEAYKNKSQAISAANSISSFLNLAEIVDKTIEKVSIEG